MPRKKQLNRGYDNPHTHDIKGYRLWHATTLNRVNRRKRHIKQNFKIIENNSYKEYSEIELRSSCSVLLKWRNWSKYPL